MTFGEELYRNVAPLAREDAANDFALQKYCQALGLPFETIYSLVRDTTDGKVGWSILLDPNRVPDEFLPWLMQLSGTRPTAGELAASMRQKILDAEVFKRGTLQSLYDAATRAGAPTFLVQERYGGSAYAVRFLFAAAEFTDEILARVVSKLPAGIVWSYGFWENTLYADWIGDYTDYQDLKDTNADYQEARGG